MSDAKARHVDAIANDTNALFRETDRLVKIVAQRFRNRKNPISDVPKQSLNIEMNFRVVPDRPVFAMNDDGYTGNFCPDNSLKQRCPAVSMRKVDLVFLECPSQLEVKLIITAEPFTKLNNATAPRN